MAEEPVRLSRSAGCPGVRVVGAAEHSGQTQSADHGEEVAPLILPVLLGAVQTEGVVEDLPTKSHSSSRNS